MNTNQGVANWESEKVSNGTSVVLQAPTGATDIIYCRDVKSTAWRPVELPYSANWDELAHDGKQFVVRDSRNSRLQAVSTDGKTWHDAGT